MSARDELAADWEDAYSANTPVVDYLFALGYRKPRTISTAEELDGLEVGAIILDSDPDCCVKSEHGRWRSMNEPEETYSTANICGSLPATVLYEPTA